MTDSRRKNLERRIKIESAILFIVLFFAILSSCTHYEKKLSPDEYYAKGYQDADNECIELQYKINDYINSLKSKIKRQEGIIDALSDKSMSKDLGPVQHEDWMK